MSLHSFLFEQQFGVWVKQRLVRSGSRLGDLEQDICNEQQPEREKFSRRIMPPEPLPMDYSIVPVGLIYML
jgi:hypothetical protein